MGVYGFGKGADTGFLLVCGIGEREGVEAGSLDINKVIANTESAACGYCPCFMDFAGKNT